MLLSMRPEMTVSPSSSTLAAILWRMEVSRSLACISSVPLEARMRMPPRTGMVEWVAMPFETTERALASDDWLTVKRMRSPYLYLLYIDIKGSGYSKHCRNVEKLG